MLRLGDELRRHARDAVPRRGGRSLRRRSPGGRSMTSTTTSCWPSGSSRSCWSRVSSGQATTRSCSPTDRHHELMRRPPISPSPATTGESCGLPGVRTAGCGPHRRTAVAGRRGGTGAHSGSRRGGELSRRAADRRPVPDQRSCAVRPRQRVRRGHRRNRRGSRRFRRRRPRHRHWHVRRFAEEVTVAAAGLARIPDGVDDRTAAAFGVAYRTAYHTLRSVARVQSGDELIVLGAGGGVGLAAVQLARAARRSVTAVASSDEKLDVASSYGAGHLINHRAVPLRDALREALPDGADAVIDPVGGELSEPALRSLRRGGRFVTVGFASGVIPRIPLNLVLVKGVAVLGFQFQDVPPTNSGATRTNCVITLSAVAYARTWVRSIRSPKRFWRWSTSPTAVPSARS